MRAKLKFAAIGILGAAGTSLATGLLVRRHYLNQMNEELEESYQAYKKINNEALDLLKLATYEIHEMRYALKCMVDEMQYDTIMAQIEYKYSEYAKDHPEMDVSSLRETVERYVESHEKTVKRKAERISEQETEKKIRDDYIDISKSLGYHIAETDPRSAVEKAEYDAYVEARRRAYREAVEQQMAEEECPYEEVGSERLAPNGDILDDAYDPREDLYDDFDSSEEATEEELRIYHEDQDPPDPIPYIISEDEFIYRYSRAGQDQISIEYFALDDTLMDEDETPMSQEHVGVENLKEFERTDAPSIFVRNEALGIDYEILYNEGSYRVDILDEPEGETIRKRIWRNWEKE